MRIRAFVYGAVPVAILLDEALTFADLKVYTVLASFQGSNDDAYPSREAIIARCGLVAETISRSVGHLIERGWVERKRRPNQTSVYRVMVESEAVYGSDSQITSGSDGPVTPDVTSRSYPSIEQKRQLKGARKKPSLNAIFIPPTVDELRAYCQERQNNVNPEKWLAHYQSNGWKVGRSAMKDWKAAVRTWEHSDWSKPAQTQRPEGPSLNDVLNFEDPVFGKRAQ